MTYQTSICIASYIRLLNRDGSPIANRSYQNFLISETRAWEGASYLFAPFAIDGDQVSSVAAGSRAVLVAPANVLTQSLAAEACLNRWLLQVKLVVLSCSENATFPTWTELSTIATDIWLCATYRGSRSDGSVQMELVAPLDAVEALTPSCVLQQYQVGNLPVTGNILVG